MDYWHVVHAPPCFYSSLEWWLFVQTMKYFTCAMIGALTWLPKKTGHTFQHSSLVCGTQCLWFPKELFNRVCVWVCVLYSPWLSQRLAFCPLSIEVCTDPPEMLHANRWVHTAVHDAPQQHVEFVELLDEFDIFMQRKQHAYYDYLSVAVKTSAIFLKSTRTRR